MLFYICFQLAFNDSAKYEWFTSKDKLSSSLDPKKPKLQDLKPEFWTFKQEGFFFTPEKLDIGKQVYFKYYKNKIHIVLQRFSHILFRIFF